MNSPNNDKKTGMILALIGIIPVTWAAIIVAPFLSEGLIGIVEGFSKGMTSPFSLKWCGDTPRTILIFLLIYGIGIGVYCSTRRNYRRGEEHGSAKWGDAKQLCRKYADRDFCKNRLLTQNTRIGLDGRKHRRNLNVMVVGGSGAGKTRFYAKPNIMQANCSYVVLDPKGEILRDTGRLLEKMGYEICVLDLINLQKSHGYNPFAYMRSETDVLKLVENLIQNTTPKGSQSNDPFWERAEKELLTALMLYLRSEAPPEEQNFSTIMEMVGAAEVRETDEEYASVLDELFERLAMREPEHLAVKQYRLFKTGAGKTEKSILISLGVRLERFNIPQIAGLTAHDELDLVSLGLKKKALFAIIPDSDTSLNFIVGMMYTQLFQELEYYADHISGGRLPVHVHFMMDEFANIALPSDFEKHLSTMRSRELSVSIILQNIAQLKALFEKQWESIMGNCDTFLYLGGNEDSTHELVSKKLGKATIDLNACGRSTGRSGNYSTNFQLSARELYTQDEVRMLDNRYALLFLRGERAVQDEKYDILKHPNIALTADGGAPPYLHGQTPNAFDPKDILLTGDISDYEIMSEEEIYQEIYENMEEKQNENV